MLKFDNRIERDYGHLFTNDVKRVEIDHGKYSGLRFYTDGVYLLPSATTVIGHGEQKGIIITRWRSKWERLLKEYGFSGYDVSRYFHLASDRGTMLHESVESLHEFQTTTYQKDKLSNDVYDYIERLEGFMVWVKETYPKKLNHKCLLSQHPSAWWRHIKPYMESLEGKILAQELKLFSVDTGVAGTADLFYLDKSGNGVVADYKFTGYPKIKEGSHPHYSWSNPSDQFHEKWLQLTAYGDTLNKLIGFNLITKMHLISTHPEGVESFEAPIDKHTRDVMLGIDTPDYREIYQNKKRGLLYG